jgi:dTMP kinase
VNRLNALGKCFITVEGIEGVGKSTNMAFIHSWLEERGAAVVTTREPGGTPGAEAIRNLVLDTGRDEIPDTSELLLMFAARAAHLKNLIVPALESGSFVLCDRFTDASYAYQGCGRGLPVDTIETLESMVQGDLRPGLTVLLDGSYELSVERRVDRTETDRFEQEKFDFFQKVRNGYLAIAEREPHRVKVIDAGQSIDAVQGAIATVLADFYPEL